MFQKYTIFVSSTYLDLKEEREEIRNAIIKMGHIPVGMEYFPATNKTQWEVIQRLIDDCDYYVLIIGGRYGTIDRELKISYTQREFQYAMDIQKPLLVFILDEKSDHPSNTSAEKSKTTQSKMRRFRIKAENNRLCKYWTTSAGLLADVVISLYSEIQENPQLGWVKNAIHYQAEDNVHMVEPENVNQTVQITEPWQILLKYDTTKPEELDMAYNSVLLSLEKVEYTSAVPLAVIAYAFSFLHIKKVKYLTEDIERSILENFKNVLTSCNNREELYEMKLDYSKSMNQLCFQKPMPEKLLFFNKSFFEQFQTTWDQIRDKMTIALEDITDSSALIPLTLLHEAIPDHSILYEQADVFDKVNVDKMVASVKRLSNKGRSQLASFFIERYKLRYYMAKEHQQYARPCEVSSLKEFASQLSSLAEKNDGIIKLSFQSLASIVNKAKQRADGITTQLITFDE